MSSTTDHADNARTADQTENPEHLVREETAAVFVAFPPQAVGTTHDIVAKDWVGAGHSVPDELTEDQDDEPGAEHS
jgi:hypothetical protein